MEANQVLERDAAAPSSPQPVLVVDDSALVRSFVAAHLRRAGYVVLEAKDGAEALELFKSQPVQVVITDVGMPRLGGLGLLAVERASEARVREEATAGRKRPADAGAAAAQPHGRAHDARQPPRLRRGVRPRIVGPVSELTGGTC